MNTELDIEGLRKRYMDIVVSSRRLVIVLVNSAIVRLEKPRALPNVHFLF